MKKYLGLLLSCFWGTILAGPFRLPSIPDIMKPPVPYERSKGSKSDHFPEMNHHDHEGYDQLMTFGGPTNLPSQYEVDRWKISAPGRTECSQCGKDRKYLRDSVQVVIPYLLRVGELDEEAMRALAEQDPEVTPGLFQGDMALNNEVYDYWRVGLRWDIFPERMWENGTVPYVISPLYEPAEYITIRRAIATISFMTCVKFVPWNGKAKDFLLIWPIKFPKGCWSFVGRYGGPQIVSLEPPDEKGPNCLGNEGRAMHELLHALGIFHEQSREDRDKFVKIHKENIIPQFLSNFDRQSLENTTYKFEYDYDSIMHYGKNFFRFHLVQHI